MGPLRLIKDLPHNFLVMNGDILTDLDYAKLHDEHVLNDEAFTVSAMTRNHRVDYGVLETSAAGQLTGFREKPSVSYQVSMGGYVVSRRVADQIPTDRAFGFDDLMLSLIASGDRVS